MMNKNDKVKYKNCMGNTGNKITFKLICRYEKVKGFPFWRVQEFFKGKPTKYYFIVLESLLEHI